MVDAGRVDGGLSLKPVEIGLCRLQFGFLLLDSIRKFGFPFLKPGKASFLLFNLYKS